jgi:hypothetical protein
MGIVTLMLCGLGIALTLRQRRHQRLANAGVTLATFVAVVLVASTVTSGGGNPESGLLLATLVLFVSLVIQACVTIWIGLMHARREAPIRSAGERAPPSEGRG